MIIGMTTTTPGRTLITAGIDESSPLNAIGGEHHSKRQTCPICYDEFILDDSANDQSQQHQLSLLTILPCQHVCCRDCLYQHCQYWITLHKVPVLCPLHIGPTASPPTLTCSTSLSNAMVHDIVCSCDKNKREMHQQEDDLVVCEDSEANDNQLWKKYCQVLKKKRLRNDSARRRTCSCCHSSFVSYEDSDSTICAMCRHALMLHPYQSGMTTTATTLDEMVVVDIQELLAAQQILKSMPIKPCSHCYMPLNKTGGCDHVVCPACHQDMCYKCGTHEFLQGDSYVISCSQW
jgi:hypothetical protein